ncbi:hypothetical protein ACOSQ3_024945 [Xanthoceras sorbifolium]
MWETNTVHLAIRMWETHRLTACARDFFVCCVGKKTDGHLFYIEAYRRGAVAVVASKEIFELSLFETQVLVNTPHEILEVSSGLLGRHSIYSILAAVAVGAPLEDIVRGIEEVDAVPGKVELIDEEQAFGVIVDYARTPDALSRLLDA